MKNLECCDMCGGEHPVGFTGDCRDDENRYPKRELPGFEITYADGQKTRTSMARGVTLEDAKAYFVGKGFDLGSGWKKNGEPIENMQRAIDVKQL
jgi:hypothetical protein